MKFLKDHIKDILTAIGLAAVGIFLLVEHERYTKAALMILGVFLVVIGIVRIIRYFRTPAEEAVEGQFMFIGLIFLSLGLLCIFGYEQLKSVFAQIVVLYGLLQIILGFDKLQNSINMLRLRIPMWYLFTLGALLSVVFGCIIVIRSADDSDGIWILTAVFLIAGALFDTFCLTAAGVAFRNAALTEKVGNKENGDVELFDEPIKKSGRTVSSVNEEDEEDGE